MSQQIVDSVLSKVEGFIHGQGRDEILAKLEQNPTPETIAAVTYKIITSAHDQAEQRGAAFDVEVLMAVATETIDMLIEILEAMGVKMNLNDVREESLIQVVIMHGEQVEGDPEERAAAQELLKELSADGTMEKSMKHIENKADASSEQMQQAGAAMAAPQQKPLAEGIQRGLMQ